jgi:ABC-type multidrug transport system fused ATPase/permease subunit
MLNHHIQGLSVQGVAGVQYPQDARAIRVKQYTGSLAPGSARESNKSEVLQSLLAQDTDGLEWILEHVARTRQDLKVSLHRSKHHHEHASSDVALPVAEDNSLQPSFATSASSNSLGQNGSKLATIQFSSSEFHIRDEEEFVEIEIIRTGNKACRSEVTLVTKDQTAKAGEYYVAMEDRIVFEPGVGSIIHQVELMGVTHWEALLDFKIEMQPDTVVGAKIGRQLNSCRVKIICNDTFPHVDLDEDLEEDPELEEHHTKIKFYFAFLNMLWSEPNIRKGTIKRCLEDQLHNINFVVIQFLMVFSVNYIFSTPKHGEAMSTNKRIEWLYAIIGIQVVSLAVLHIMDYMRLTWGVGGPSRKIIQKALLRRFMYYDAPARSSTNPSDLVMAISRDAIGLCSGYSAAMKVVQALGGLVAIFFFKISSPFVFGKADSLMDIRWIGFLPFLVFPTVLAIYMHFRSDYTTECLEKKEEATNDMVTFCNKAVECFPLVSDYKRRQRYVDGLDGPIVGYNGANKAYNKADLHNKYFPDWVVLVFICFWYWFYGREVIWGSLSLGFFLADIKIIEKFGSEFAKLYMLCMKIESTFPDLCRITTFLNKPTDLEERLINEKDVLRRTRILRKQMASAGEGALDRVPIFVRDLKFRMGIPFNFRGTIDIPQGSMVCFVGSHGAGKSTLLKVLGSALFPQIDGGEVFVPAHVRSLHVSLEPYFFEGTLMENMCFGVEIPSDGEKNRVRKILTALHCEDCVDGGVDSTCTTMWQSQLTVKERHTLNLARALIANPYLLCIHKPTMAYGAKNSDVVMNLIKDFVRNRGVEQGNAPIESRRPRTVIYTSFRKDSTGYADKIFKIAQNEICEIKHDEVLEDMF